ncbi:MAG: ATP synthase F1 subunit gamma [Pirellulales bacterium]|nr:ATP synthase F1 subunit gamma [Pirellulales bacterium]
MANPRALDRRRKAVRNIRKITRTMELIATARFKKAMDRASAATAYTRRITELVAKLANAGLEVSHPLLEQREEIKSAQVLVLAGNRGFCGGFNGNVNRLALNRIGELREEIPAVRVDVSGKRAITGLTSREVELAETYTHFEDKPTFAEVELIATRYLEAYQTGELDRLDVVYTRFDSIARQTPMVETLLPLGSLDAAGEGEADADHNLDYEFLPSAESILEEVVPTSFKVRLFKCFLDSAVSEQVARMIAMKGATENADGLIKSLSMAYNRARQSRITSEILEVIGGVEALKQ